MRIDADFSDRLIKSALSHGADMAEVYQRASSSLSVEVKGGKVESLKNASGFGYGLRVIRGRRLGFTYSTDREQADEVLKMALEGSEFTEADEFLDLPEAGTPTRVPEVFDHEVDKIDEAAAIQMASLIEEAALSADPRIRKVRKALAAFSKGMTHIANSKGLSYGYASTFCSAQIMCVAEEGEESQMGWGYEGGRFLGDVSFSRAGSEAAGRALSMMGARKMDRPSSSLVLLDSAVAGEFISVIASMISSEAVQKGKSLLKDKAGTKVISGKLNVIDDALMSHGPGARHMDDEGVPAARNVFIRDGILLNYMYNTQTALKGGTASTGNAVRGGFSSVPSVGPVNLYVSGNGKPVAWQEMISGMDEGLYVLDAMGVHTINRVSGDFSVGVSGLWISGGAVKYPVREAVMSGNILDLFMKVEAVGDDLKFYGNIGAPSLLLGPADISA